MTEQETANAIGAALREAEAAAEAEGATDTQAKLAVLHGALAQGYSDFFPALDWNEIIGAGDAAKGGAHTDGGAQKPPPPPG